MDKKTLLQNFNEEDRVEVLNLYEKYELSYNKDIPMFGNNFYPPNIWKFFEKFIGTNDFKVTSSGFFEDSERRMISFNNIYDIPYPMKILKITNSSKFTTPSHRDFLGSVLGLGIKRNKIGDLMIKNGECYLAVCEEISEFVANNLDTIGRSPCKVIILEEDFVSLTPEFKEEIILIPSLRLDSIVSKLSKLSRSKGQDLIESGKVLIDYNAVRDKSKEVSNGERITIRGIGKFILGDVIGNSKSGKYKVVIKKYI